MKAVYKKYLPEEEIAVYDCVRYRKLMKYYTRETMAAVVAVFSLFPDCLPDPCMPFFYSSGETDKTGLCDSIASKIALDVNDFQPGWFPDKVAPLIPPLERFKAMRNTTACLIAIENGLKGDNAVLLDSVSGLIYSAMLTETDGPVLVGAGKLYADGMVECGFAKGLPAEFAMLPMPGATEDAFVFFRNLTSTGRWQS